jgi:Na+/proline symporter/signal transduction histidine kinase/CheY-like chemotaxis protein
MFNGWALIAIAVAFVGALFLIAAIGDRLLRNRTAHTGRPLIYALSLAVYCTSWTFFGSVGLAASTGWDFIGIYLGPILLFTLGQPLLLRVVRLAKRENLTSVADFLAARYGKSQAVAATVTLVLVIGTLPYIALQLKAVSGSVTTVVGLPLTTAALSASGHMIDPALIVAVVLALFAILFGTRHTDATEHQDGLMLAIAAESLVKLAAFLAIGIFVFVQVFGGFQGLFDALAANPPIADRFAQPLNGGTWLTYIVLSFIAALLLPRQFHVTVVENKSEREIRRASWLFPLYLVLINLFVVPIAIAGLLLLPGAGLGADFYVLTLPLKLDQPLFGAIALIGGLSAATAMVIVESIALAIMVSNGVVVPLLVRNRLLHGRFGSTLLIIRRIAIVVILMLGYAVYELLAGLSGLVALGLLSFAAIAQLAPAFLGGLIWHSGTARGAIAGIVAGFAIWGYTLILPWLARGGYVPFSLVADGPFGLTMLRPEALFYLQFEPLAHGVLWSLAGNIVAFISVSLMRPPIAVERMQSLAFVETQAPRPDRQPGQRQWRTAVTVGDLMTTVGRYLGRERTERSFQQFAASHGATLRLEAEVDVDTLRFAEHLLTSAIGAASSRLVLSLLFGRGTVSASSALRLLDDASEALQYNRDLLQSALDEVRHGLGVFDADMRLICWNRQYREILSLPLDLGRVGTPLDRIIRALAERGDLGPGLIEDLVADRLVRIAVNKETLQERMSGGRALEVRTSALPQGGLVVTYLDVTERVDAARVLERANESLERRVAERTAELVYANRLLDDARGTADTANREKTRLLVGASHDLLQPLSAARLYATSLVERPLSDTDREIAHNLDASLSSVEEILGTLIDISRMDSGRLEPEFTDVDLGLLLDQLAVQFRPMALAKGLELDIVSTSLVVYSDRRLLRRVLQNFLSNAVKYTRRGRVLLGVRRRAGAAVITVVDTGPGIPDTKRDIIFKEFQRLDPANASERGLGLGLSIVERIGRVIEAQIALRSVVGRGSAFSVTVPVLIRPPESATVPQIAGVTARAMNPLEGCIVLCVDNDPTVLKGLATLLSGWGCTVATAADYDEALAAVARIGGQPDLLLVDFHLDQGTGVDVSEALCRVLGIDVPTIVITADQTVEMHRDLRAGGFASLKKPVKAAALRALMTQHVLRRPAAAAS